MSLPCYYAIGGLNYKNGFVTSCPQQWEKFQIIDQTYLPSEFFNNENLKQHRKKLMSGEWCVGCDMCEHVEKENAGQSMRQEIPVDLQYYNHETGETAFEGLKTIEMRFSHSCNMACLHCSKVFSSGWLTKLKKYKPTQEDYDIGLIQLTGWMHKESLDEDYTMSISTERSIEIFEDLNKNFPNLERVDFAGGEVLYQKQFFPSLEKLAEHPNAKNIKIMFHSNFNADFDPIKLSKLLKKFGSVHIQISVDAGPRIYSYFRDGDWNKLKKNLDEFKKVDNNHCNLNIVCTTGTYQLMEIKDVMLSFLSLDVNYIDASIIYTPDYLNPSVMMLKYRSKVLNDIEETRNHILALDKERRRNIEETKNLRSFHYPTPEHPVWGDIVGALDSLEKIRRYILNHKSKKSDWNTFMTYIQRTDKIWKQNFNDHFVNYKFLNNEVVENVWL